MPFFTATNPERIRLPRSDLERLRIHLNGWCEPGPGRFPNLSDDEMDARAAILLGGVHEWFVGTSEQEPDKKAAFPPLGVLIAEAWRAVDSAARSRREVVWIGRWCWPCPQALLRRSIPSEPVGGVDRRLLERSLFVDVGHARAERTAPIAPAARNERAERVWSIEQAARCAGVAMVVADGAGVTMAESRRLQLAASAAGVPVMLARPWSDRGELSAARTRWRVLPRVSSQGERAWRLELLRCKGWQPTGGGVRRWAVRRDDATGTTSDWASVDVDLDADVVDRPAPASGSRIA